ncbi:hypothetical protein QBC34DRAFT_464461 [Podospora aff. communis PSN243]|uniref:DUF7932 domain-containing protein n=1 Tax=Podospora aff. communis PSN243 TaxID=3040156 RepID=A0AAV9GJQ9_9PEZI|nr:hypothetical protein QBC34DRAFT_464461 [Podospora aff. communis PSN243]
MDLKVIDTSGRDGAPGAEFFAQRAPEAPMGQNGVNGCSAGYPTAGSPGTDIRIRLTYSDDEPGAALVSGEGGHSGQRWKISRNERLLLKANGGNGGAGGRGENGQAGGPGRHGRDATKYSHGEDGGNGGRGGDGGVGSDGANGAPGGNVFVTVHDDDTDLLLPLEYNTKGGEGGASGLHGEPGDGGRGGRGGNGYAWSDGDTARLPPSPPTTAAHGSIQIRVIRGDLSEATYPGPYVLQLLSFAIVDENQDGFNEPGEHLLVHSIRVRNVGHMPSPSSRLIHLLIQGTQWLQPVEAEPLELPPSIQPGQEVLLPGMLRAYIRNEWAPKAPGIPLNAIDSVMLTAYFPERLRRPIPNFCTARSITIKYPLRLDPPTYLDCVAKGDKVRFAWMVHNDSIKGYGLQGTLKRACATRLLDEYRFFDLTYMAEDKPGEAVDDIDEFEANSTVTIDQEFSVNDLVMEFSDGFLTLELLLADPITGIQRSIQTYQMRMQISGVYHLSPDPSYLLVVNSATPNHAIHQIIELVRNRLHTKLDIFNLSLTGSYESPVTKENVLRSYVGKTLLLFANPFLYFSREVMNPWDLLDPWETGLILQGGTSLLFVGLAAAHLASLQSWARHATFPAHHLTSAQSSSAAAVANPKELARTLREASPDDVAVTAAAHRYPVSLGGLNCFGDIESAVDQSAAKAAKDLTRNMPLRRFVAVPDAGALQGKTGGVVICEGVPRMARMKAVPGIFGPSPAGTNAMADADMYFIVSCLPLPVRARMFWNMVGRVEARGVPCSVLYNGAENFLRPLAAGCSPDSTFVDEKIIKAICLSLQFDLTGEIYHFTGTKPRFPDPIPAAEKLSQLPLTSLFFSLWEQSAGPRQLAAADAAQLFAWVLGAVHAQANPLSFWQSMKQAFACCGNRKANLTAKLNERISLAVEQLCGDAAAAVQAEVSRRSSQVKTGIAAKAGGGHPKNFDVFGLSELEAFVGVAPGTLQVHELTALVPTSVGMTAAQLAVHQDQYYVGRQVTGRLEQHAKAQIDAMVNPTDEEEA